jgi:hypothetical protein
MSEPGEFEVRADGARVRVDRWQWGVRRIAALLWGNRREFEIDEVVEAVRKLVPEPHNTAEGLCRAAQPRRAAFILPARAVDTIWTFAGLTVIAFSGAPWWTVPVAGAMSVVSYVYGLRRRVLLESHT